MIQWRFEFLPYQRRQILVFSSSDRHLFCRRWPLRSIVRSVSKFRKRQNDVSVCLGLTRILKDELIGRVDKRLRIAQSYCAGKPDQGIAWGVPLSLVRNHFTPVL